MSGWFSISVAIDNKFGVKYLAGSTRNNKEVPFANYKNYVEKDYKLYGKTELENMLKQFSATNQNRNYDQFWSIYNKEKQDIITAVNRGALDRYTPMQIRISIENALKKLNSISVIGCEGYTKMKKIAGRKI